MYIHPWQLQSACHAHAMCDRNSKRLNRQPEATNCHLKQSHTHTGHTHMHISNYTLTHTHAYRQPHLGTHTHTPTCKDTHICIYILPSFVATYARCNFRAKGEESGQGQVCSSLSCSLRHVQQFDTQFKCRICCCNRLSACCVFKAHLNVEKGGGGRARVREAGVWQKSKRGVGVITNTPTRQLAAAKKCEMQDTQ